MAYHPGLAFLRVSRRMLRTSRSRRISRIARMLLVTTLHMVLDMALGISLDTATGEGMGRDIGVGREAYAYPAAYPNSNSEVRPISTSG